MRGIALVSFSPTTHLTAIHLPSYPPTCPYTNSRIIKEHIYELSKRYKIKQNLTCNSDFLIYLVTCRKCHGKYVGKSQTKLKLRHSNHMREIKNDIDGLGIHSFARISVVCPTNLAKIIQAEILTKMCQIGFQ